MTTGLVTGMPLQKAAVVVAAKAASQLRPGDGLAFWTETGSSSVLVGVATPELSYAVAIDRSEYDGLKLMEILFGRVLHKGPAGLAAAS